eukprot:11030634-Lingulodinium_polyedra.AAC.1
MAKHWCLPQFLIQNMFMKTPMMLGLASLHVYHCVLDSHNRVAGPEVLSIAAVVAAVDQQQLGAGFLCLLTFSSLNFGRLVNEDP